MFKVLLNNFLHTTLSSSSQNELDFVIFHILLICTFSQKELDCMILHILNPRQKNACTQDPLCALVAFLNIHCFPKLCGLFFSRVVFMCSSSTMSCVFQFAIQLFGNLAILVFLFCLGSDTSLLLSSQLSSPSRSHHFSLWRWLQASFVSVTHLICPNTFLLDFFCYLDSSQGSLPFRIFGKVGNLSQPAGTSSRGGGGRHPKLKN